MRIKLTILLILIGMLAECNVFAEVAVKTTSAADGFDKIEITVSDDKDSGWITVFVSGEDGQRLSFMDQQRKRLVNYFEFTISPDIKKYRDYTVTVKTDTGTEEKDFIYYTYKEKTDAISNILNSTEINSNDAEILSLDITNGTLYNSLNNKSVVISEIKKNASVKPENIGEIFEKASIIAALKSKTAKTLQILADNHSEMLELDKYCSTELGWYADIKNKTEFFARMAKKEYSDVESFNAEFCSLAFLFELSNTPYMELRSFIEANNNKYSQDGKVFKIDFDAIDVLSGGKTDVALNSVAGILYNSPADFESALKAAATEAKKPVNQVNAAGGKTSSDSGGFSIVTTTNITEIGSASDSVSLVKFSDIGNVIWAKNAINNLAERGVISGMSEGVFAPELPVKREQFIKMVVLAFEYDASYTKTEFDDALDGEWYIPYIESGRRNGIMLGRGKLFGVGEAVSRQDVAAVLYRILQNIGIEMLTEGNETFSDSNEISNYAVDAVRALYNEGIISGTGNGCISPQRFATRAEAAKLIYDAWVFLEAKRG